MVFPCLKRLCVATDYGVTFVTFILQVGARRQSVVQVVNSQGGFVLVLLSGFCSNYTIKVFLIHLLVTNEIS